MGEGPVLFLTGDYGSGHVQAARALQESFTRLFPYIGTESKDFMSHAHPIVHPISKFMYLGGIKAFPRTYGYLFQKTRRSNKFSNGLKVFHGLGLGKFLSMLRSVQPSAVVSTFPLAAAAMSFLRANGLFNVPTITVITDYTDHSYWINPHTDAYLVGSRHTADHLVKLGIDLSQVRVTGIPIRREYSHVYNRKEIRAKIGLTPDLPTVLVMGGGYGMLGQEIGDTLCRYLHGNKGSMQVIAVCGHNDKLRNHLSSIASEWNLPMVVTGFTEHIPEFMATSDLLITKSGGLTSSEALAAGLPMLIYKPLPGQEEDNANYLLDAGAAVRLNHVEELLQSLSALLSDPVRLKTMKRQAKKTGKPFSADRAAECIVEIREQGMVTMPSSRVYSFV
ncbi:glycosyltransferase [Paenibacillus sp. BR2-3]|uniref:MGDG synthase family glycosyltransferase n=1 Tax=Paenibacillus sp. BR2-3 TaxID=3048494 RepID=UPI0039774454